MKLKLITLIISFLLLSVYVPCSESGSSETVMFTKYYPHGDTETISLKIDFDGIDEKSKVIANKCKDLFIDDTIFQHYLQNNSETLYIIISGGSGFHINFPSSFFRSSIFDIIFSLFPSLIYCKYNSDAATNIFPINAPDNTTDVVGEHKLVCVGFMGVIGWQNIISRTNTGFAGITLYYQIF